MDCRLCLTKCNDNIYIFSEEKIPGFISRVLQLELTPEDPVSNVACALCWQELINFQNFCERVQEAQKCLLNNKSELKMEVSETISEDTNVETPFVEYENINLNVTDALGTSNTYPYFEIVELHKEEITEPSISSTFETIQLPLAQRTTRATRKKILTVAQKEIITKSAQTRSLRQKKEKEINKREETFETTDEGDVSVKPRKANRRTNIKKVWSERATQLLETSLKFDEIIKEHMTLVCDICGVKLTDFAELKVHFRRVHDCKGYAVCCNKRMHKRHLVVDHISTHDGTSHICNECGKKTSSKDALRSHMKYVHLTKREFQCSFCDKAFKKALDLKEHTATHTGEVLYMCPHCPKTFTSRATMHGHRKEKHRAEWETKKRCSYF